MGEIITIKSDDWLKNAGICGLYNILEKAGYKDQIEVRSDEIKFPVELLKGFSDMFFNYLIETYKDTFSLFRIINAEKLLDNWIENDFEKFEKKELDLLNLHIENFKKYIKSNSYKSAYKLIGGNVDPELLEKNLQKIKLKKKEKVLDRIEDIKSQIATMKEIITYFKSDGAIKYIGAKNAIYNIIRNAWDGVSFLNRQCKNPDMYDEYQDYFVNPAIEYIEDIDKNKTKFKYQCLACSSKIKDLNSDIGFIREMGFDTNRKTSHVWDFNNYVAICPICRLVYSCVPAGINYAFNKGIFINYSMDLNDLIKINKKINFEIHENSYSGISIYKSIQDNMNENLNENSQYELSDVQVVRFYRDVDKDSIKYYFNIINKVVLETISSCKTELNTIKQGKYSENSNDKYIYNEVMEKLLNNQNQFLLVQKLLHYKLSIPDSTYYKVGIVSSILKINIKYLEEAGYVKKLENNLVDEARIAGHYLQKAYNISGKGKVEIDEVLQQESSENEDKKKNNNLAYNKKLNGIAYRMLNALKTNNKHSFMDTLINAYMYVGKSIPKIFAENLEDDLVFKNIGYAFITGMIGYIKEENKDKEENK